MTSNSSAGRVVGVSGPVADVVDLPGVRLNDVLAVGEDRLVGEVIRLRGKMATAQIYENTSGLSVGEPVTNTGEPISVELGPGLLGSIFDGLQRPLGKMVEAAGNFIARGEQYPSLDPERGWDFEPRVSEGDEVQAGEVLGAVDETPAIEHRIMVPPGQGGVVRALASGKLGVEEVIAKIETPDGEHLELRMKQSWPVRRSRPVFRRLRPDQPLVTGTRIIDGLFPLARGGAAIIPGGFGTGKTVAEQTLARFANVDVVVYVGCGERGNEMAEVLESFPELDDPRTGASLIDRTILIANTSNMPVAARESSIYAGITIAEYYRDMGYDTLLLADSTSRWGEALREISGVLEEMPAEEGFPAYLAARLAGFYERAALVECLGGTRDRGGAREGSVSVVGAVSPPGGDFSEPITQNSMRLAGTFWALDTDLARRRHFPAINWEESYSLYEVRAWFEREVDPQWTQLVQEIRILLEEDARLSEIVQLVGPEALSPAERVTLQTGRMVREDFLQQLATSEVDAFSPLRKTFWMMKILVRFHELASEAIEQGISQARVGELEIIPNIAQMKQVRAEEIEEELPALYERMVETFEELGVAAL